MTKRIIISPKASQDLDDHFAYIAESNLEAALQFFDSARLTIAQIFERDEAVEIVRILYATQDISSILAG